VRRSAHFSLTDGRPWSWPFYELGIGRDDILGLQLIASEPIVLSLRVGKAAAVRVIRQQGSHVKPRSICANRFAAKRERLNLQYLRPR